MGRMKQEWMELMESEAMHDWIAENYADTAVEEGTVEWDRAAEAYVEHYEENERSMQEAWEQDEYNYYQDLSADDVDIIFKNEISNLKILLKNSHTDSSNPTFCKMVFAHAVTILEVYLEDKVKALIISDEGSLKNTIKNVRPFSNTKFMLGDISLETDGIKKFVLRKVSDNLFHDIPKTINIIKGILGRDLEVNIEG